MPSPCSVQHSTALPTRFGVRIANKVVRWTQLATCATGDKPLRTLRVKAQQPFIKAQQPFILSLTREGGRPRRVVLPRSHTAASRGLLQHDGGDDRTPVVRHKSYGCAQ